MRKLFLLALSLVIITMVGCGSKKEKPMQVDKDMPETPDSTVYGVCGMGTSMHLLELVTDAGDTLVYTILDSEGDDNFGIVSQVEGGLMAGDKMAVTGHKVDDELIADKVINVASLLGRWTSVDRNFEIEEGGTIHSNVKAESNPWTSWKILNGRLLLNRDTFNIDNLGADSLLIENNNGIFVFKRQK